MEYVRLANSDLIVSRIAFGCEPLGGTDWGSVDEREGRAAVQRALELGINFFDTADVYGLGQSERVLSEALGRRRHEIVIATKFGVNWQDNPNGGRARTFFDSSPERVVVALENSLRRLRIDCIPLYVIHWPDPKTPIAHTMDALARCREAGKVRYIGVSNFPPNMIKQAHEFVKLSCVELPYNLIDRRAERELLPCCAELGISVLAYGPLAQGLLTGKYGPDARFGPDDRRSRLPHFQGDSLKKKLRAVQVLKELAARYNRTPSQLAVRWVLDNQTVSCAIVGAKSPVQIEDNVGALGWSLSAADRERLASI